MAQGALEHNVLGRFDAIIMAIAGSAPAFSISASTAVLVGAVGMAGPAALLYCGIPMLGIVWAFMYLGKTQTNSGASYAWVGRALHPALGYMAGWALVVSATLFMVAGSLPAGSVTLALFNPLWANNTTAVTIMGGAWFVVMAVMVLIGIRITARTQWIMTALEVAILLLFSILAFIHTTASHVAFSWSWFGLAHFHGVQGFAAGALVAAFYYWGWDVSANLNEETKQAKKLPGQGGLWGVIVIFVLFELFTVVINMSLSDKVINANSVNVLSALGQTVWPGVGGTVLSLAVMLSTIATLETSLIQVTRSLFAMGRDHTLPRVFASIHPRWNTPWIATLVVGGVALVLFFLSSFVQSVSTIMSDSISAIGLQIAIYYGLAGLAVVVAYRDLLFRSLPNFIFIGMWPLLGAAFMFWILFQSLGSLGATTVSIGLGTMALGLIPMGIYWAKGSPYFSQKGSDVPVGMAEVVE